MAPTMGLFLYKEVQIYNEEASFWMALPFWRKSWTFGNVLLGEEFQILATNFICTYLHERAISVCMHALVGLETLSDWVWSNVYATDCFSLGVNHRFCVNRMDRTWSRAQLFDASKRANLQMEIGHFPLDSFWKQSYEGYPTLGLDVHSFLAFPSRHRFWLSLGQLYETQLNW